MFPAQFFDLLDLIGLRGPSAAAISIGSISSCPLVSDAICDRARKWRPAFPPEVGRRPSIGHEYDGPVGPYDTAAHGLTIGPAKPAGEHDLQHGPLPRRPAETPQSVGENRLWAARQAHRRGQSDRQAIQIDGPSTQQMREESRPGGRQGTE